MKKIIVDPPVSEARRERVERQLFAQLAAVRLQDRADAVIPPPRKSRVGIGLAFAAVAAAAVVVLLITRGGDRGGTVVPPSRVVTPVGGTSQLNIPGHALVDVLSDTSVEWQQGADESITLKLERGTVDCDVEPRGTRGPFVVIARDMRVTVVGTRFKVTSAPPRVDVARGKVKVQALGGEWLIEAGQSWTPAGQVVQTAVAAPTPEPAAAEPEPEIEMDPMDLKKRSRVKKAPAAPAPPADVVAPPKQAVQTQRKLEEESYRVGVSELEKNDPKTAIKVYRAIVTTGKGNAALALYSIADVYLDKLKDAKSALEALDELARKFPHSANAEEAAWMRVEALLALRKRDEARGAAANYLREFPNGAYADPAARLTK